MPEARRVLAFAAKSSVVHAATYFLVGAMAYQLLTKHFYEGPDPLFARFMRTPAEPDAWAHVMRWFLPAQLLRGALMGLALAPFLETLAARPWRRRALALAGVYLVFGFWGTAVAAPGTIEGLVYLRPEFDARVHLLVQPEILAQALLWAAALAAWTRPRPA
jgi:hypothetical protein